VRYDKRADIHEAFLSLGCALICCQSLRKTWRTACEIASIPVLRNFRGQALSIGKHSPLIESNPVRAAADPYNRPN